MIKNATTSQNNSLLLAYINNITIVLEIALFSRAALEWSSHNIFITFYTANNNITQLVLFSYTSHTRVLSSHRAIINTYIHNII